jgi:hypothetical protein
MRCITTLSMMRGLVVHEVIAYALNEARQGRRVQVGEAKEKVTELMRKRYMESAQQLWHIDNRPRGVKASQITNLLEHYYKFPETAQRARDHRQTAFKCVENLLGSEMWEQIAGSDPETWKTVDEDGFPSFDLDGIQVYAVVDFAHAHDGPTIIDWKTGASGDDDRLQLALYSLYAQSKWGWKPGETTLAAVYLQPEMRIDSFTPSGEDTDAITEVVKQSFGEMMKLEPAYGPAKIDDFPLTENVDNCKWCRFRGICEGAKRIPEYDG